MSAPSVGFPARWGSLCEYVLHTLIFYPLSGIYKGNYMKVLVYSSENFCVHAKKSFTNETPSHFNRNIVRWHLNS